MIFTIDSAHAGERLDVFLAREGDVTRSRAGALIREGAARVNGSVPSKAGYALREGDEVSFEVPEPAPAHVAAEDIPLEIVYQDDDLAVVYKPSGMVVHPAAGNPDGTMVNALLMHLDGLSGIGGEIRPGIVHRIDKDTSGLLLVAKNDRAHVSLAEQIREHSVERAYLAICIGHFKEDMGVVDAPIARHPTDRKKMAVYPASEPHTKYAYTGYQVLAQYNGFTHIACRLKTGRTHQIRVHMASLGHPVAGDPVYGPAKGVKGLHGQCLHAAVLGFIHPVSGEHLLFETPLPDYFSDFLARLRKGETYGPV